MIAAGGFSAALVMVVLLSVDRCSPLTSDSDACRAVPGVNAQLSDPPPDSGGDGGGGLSSGGGGDESSDGGTQTDSGQGSEGGAGSGGSLDKGPQDKDKGSDSDSDESGEEGPPQESQKPPEGESGPAGPEIIRVGSAPEPEGSTRERSLEEPAVTECQSRVLGSERYHTIRAGTARATPDEAARAHACFGRPVNHYEYRPGSPPRTLRNCLAAKVGGERLRAIERGEPLTSLEELRATRACFGIEDSPLVPWPTVSVPPSVENCLRQGVGGERLAHVLAGGEPTTPERQAAAACFQPLRGLQTTILPLAAEEVQFLQTDPASTAVAHVRNALERVGGRERPRIVFQGSGPVGAIVDLYLFSANPIVVALATDANGVWRYDLDQPLSEGGHRALSVVKLSGREPIKSSSFPFAVARAAETGTREAGLIVVTGTAPRASRQYLSSAAIIVSLGVLIAVGIILLLLRPKPARAPARPPVRRPPSKPKAEGL